MRYFLTFFIILCSSLFSADVNRTIIDADSGFYQKILLDISNAKEQKPEYILEKTLLSALIKEGNETALVVSQNYTLPKNSDEFEKLFQKYIDNLKALATTQKQIDDAKEKIETIEQQIAKLDSNNSSVNILQLQDALHHKKLQSYQKMLSVYTENMEKIQKLIKGSLSDMHFDRLKIKSVIEQDKRAIEAINRSISKEQISLEQVKLLNNSDEIKKHITRVTQYKDTQRKIHKDIAALKFLLFANALQNKSYKAFEIEKEIKTALKDIGIDTSNVGLFKGLENSYLGRIKTFTGKSKEEVKSISLTLWEYLNKPIFSINNTPIDIFKLTVTILIFIISFYFGALYKKKIFHLSVNKDTFTESSRTLLANLGYYFILLISFFIALNFLGIQLSSIAMVAGALSVGIGFGLQNIVSNFVSGLILMFERSVKIGDYVQISDDLRGYITDIKMRSTTIKTNDNIDVIIPNQQFIQNNVINWTMNDKIRRFAIPFGVAYGTDPQKVIDVVKKAVQESGYGDVINAKDKHTRVIMTEMGDSSVNFELFVWIGGNEMKFPKRTQSRFLVIIYNALYANNIEIPFPQQDIHIRSIDAELPKKSKETSDRAC